MSIPSRARSNSRYRTSFTFKATSKFYTTQVKAELEKNSSNKTDISIQSIKCHLPNSRKISTCKFLLRLYFFSTMSSKIKIPPHNMPFFFFLLKVKPMNRNGFAKKNMDKDFLHLQISCVHAFTLINDQDFIHPSL